MDETVAAPKRTAMQVGLDAEATARKALNEVEALSASLADGDTADDMGAARSKLAVEVGQLREQLGGLDKTMTEADQAWRTTTEQMAEVRGNLAHLTEQMAAMPDYAGGDSKLKPQALFESVLAVDKRLRDVEEWQAATLDEDNLGSADALAERLAELERDLAELRTRPVPMGVAAGAVPPRPPVPAILGQMLELQRMVASIGKDRTATIEGKGKNQGHSYSFRGIDDAMDAVGTAMREIGIIGPRSEIIDTEWVTDAVPRFYNGKQEGVTVWTTCRVKMRYVFVSPIDGSEFPVEGVGTGRDNGDKDGSKASSAAMKYALFQGLCIPVRGVNVDPETEHPQIDYPQGYGRTYGGGRQPATQDERERALWRQNAGETPGPVDQDGRDGFDAGDMQRRYADQAASEAFDQALRNPTPETIARSTELNAQAHQQRQQDTRTPAELAAAALAAIRKAGSVAEAAAVWNYAAQAGCLSMVVEDAQLGQHLIAAIRMLPGGNALQLAGMEHFR